MSSDPSEGSTGERPPAPKRGLLTNLRTLVGWPAGVPVKWRIAGVSALLTMMILIGFAAVVGRLASNQIRSDFRAQLENAAGEVAFQYQAAAAQNREVDLDQAAMPSGAAIRIVDDFGRVLEQTGNAELLGPPSRDVREVGDLQVATALLIPPNLIGSPATYVQFARESSNVEATVNRVWIFLGSGVVVGTMLAAFAGFMVAGRAMRPIAALTSAAREIAATRDPSMKIPRPASEDEVGELARTLEDMLSELDAARTETQHAMQRQREFVADASHELRTPLTSILANLEMLEEDLAAASGPANGNGRRPMSAEDSHAAADSALRSSRRMGRLVSDLLILARADAGRPTPKAICDLSSIAAEAAAELAPITSEHRLDLQVPGPVRICGNSDDLHRLIVNLLDNAVRHTPAGTTIELEVTRRSGEAVLEVRDDGPGLPEESTDHIFERFVRSEGPADVVGGDDGTGLGLAIVRSVADTHNGSVEAGASPSGGARFTVTIPLADDGEAAQTQPMEASRRE